MSRFDRVMVRVIAGLSVLLLSLALWATLGMHDSALSPGFLYLVAVSEDETQVWHLDWDTLDTQLITQLPGSVVASTVLPGTARVVYPVARADGGHNLWLLDATRRRVRLWVDCAPDDCLAVASVPDSCSVVYTRIVAREPTLWQLLCDATTPQPLFETPEIQGHYATWSPDGTRLAYLDSGRQLCIVDVTGTIGALCLSSQTTTSPVWSPDGQQLLFADMWIGTGFASHIVRVDIASGEYVDLSNLHGVEDDAPAWSPDGQWIAFRRQNAGVAMGKQIWLMRADGSDARALTADATASHGPPVWTADGTMLVFSCHRPDHSPTIQAVSITSATFQTLVSNGYGPHWPTVLLHAGAGSPP